MTKYFLIIFFLTLSVFANEKSVRTIKVKVPANLGIAEFEIHARRKNLSAAHLVEKILLEDSAKLFQYFEYIPRGTVHLMIEDLVDSANGAATVFPDNLIYLNDYPATGDGHLSTSDDWWRVLVLHELTHIMHLDQTRGFPNSVRTIFGSVGKWNGIVPRWFSEGIAVWAESTFTENGRLNSPEVEMELRRLVAREDVCHSLACLDEPIAYPYGQLAYWMGGRFMQWLEKNKPQTVKCLVEANSDTIPFFWLDRAFEDCTGQSAGANFESFLVEYKKEIIHSDREGTKINLNLDNVGRVDWQNGRVLIGDKIYIAGVDETPEAKDWLWEVDVANQKVEKYLLPQYVERLMPGQGQIFLMLRKGIVVIDKEKWGRWNLSTHQLDYLKFPEPVEYVYEIEKQIYTIGFIDGLWVLKKLKENGELSLIYKFPEFLTIRKPKLQKVDGYLIVTAKTYDFDQYAIKQFIFNVTDLLFLRVENLVSQKSVLSLAGECGGNFYERKHGPLEVGFIEENYFVDVKKSLFLQKVENCQEYEKFGLKKIIAKAQEASPEVKLNLANTTNLFYPRPFHYLPHYWLPELSIDGKQSYIGAETSMSDPRADHTMALTYSYAYNLKEHQPDLAYINHQALAFKLDLYSSIGYKKRYYQNSFATFNQSVESTYATFALVQRFNVLTHTPILLLKKEHRYDFFSKRDENVFGVQENFILFPNKKTDLLGPLNVMAQFLHKDLNQYADYNTFESKVGWDLIPTWKSKLHLQGSYSKNDKNTFASGVIYGGGANGGVVHEFYQIDYNNAYGNEMATWRAQYSHLLMRFYKDGNVSPIYLKDFTLFGGTERIYADFIYLGNRLSNRTQLQAVHLGGRASTTLGYFAAVNIEFIVTTLVGNEKENDTRSLLLVNAGGF